MPHCIFPFIQSKIPLLFQIHTTLCLRFFIVRNLKQMLSFTQLLRQHIDSSKKTIKHLHNTASYSIWDVITQKWNNLQDITHTLHLVALVPKETNSIAYLPLSLLYCFTRGTKILSVGRPTPASTAPAR